MIRDNMSLIICLFSCFLVVLKIYTGSNVFLVIFLIVICIAIILDKIEYKFTYLIFFLPWIYVLKFQLDDFSLFLFMSLLYVVVCLFHLLIKHKKFPFSYFLSYFLFVSFVISVSLMQGGSLTLILGFLLNFTVVFLAVMFVKDKKQYGKYTIMYSLGLLTASIVRLISYAVPTMDQYLLNMTTTYTLVVDGDLKIRFAGLDIDPNYFSMHILMALSCLLVNVYHNGEKKLVSIFLIVILSIIGLLSLSKMYLISILFLLALTILSLLKNNVNFALKFIFFLLVLGTVITSFSFEYFYDSFAQRFNLEDRNLESLTTERSTAWEYYFIEILKNLNILLFGTGYGTRELEDILPHNMYLMTFYNFGLIGVLIILIYIFSLREMFLINTRQKKFFNVLSISSIPLLILLFSNLALDSIVMDFFPVHLFLVLFSLTYDKSRKSF